MTFQVRKWNESEPLLGSHVTPAHAEQYKLIGLSANHREKNSLEVSLGNKVWDFSAAVPIKKKKKKKKKRQIKCIKRGRSNIAEVSGLC